jgi:hypothetical protein
VGGVGGVGLEYGCGFRCGEGGQGVGFMLVRRMMGGVIAAEK